MRSAGDCPKAPVPAATNNAHIKKKIGETLLGIQPQVSRQRSPSRIQFASSDRSGEGSVAVPLNKEKQPDLAKAQQREINNLGFICRAILISWICVMETGKGKTLNVYCLGMFIEWPTKKKTSRQAFERIPPKRKSCKQMPENPTT